MMYYTFMSNEYSSGVFMTLASIQPMYAKTFSMITVLIAYSVSMVNISYTIMIEELLEGIVEY